MDAYGRISSEASEASASTSTAPTNPIDTVIVCRVVRPPMASENGRELENIVEVASARGPAKAASAVSPARDASEAVGGRLVLIADDYEDTRLLYAEHLEESGFRVVDAADGEQAVALALSLRPDAIVMDLSMPKLDGWDAIRRIRADERMAGVYIIALSAMESELSREMAFDAGCNDFIAKPFLAEALAQVLKMHFRGGEGNDA